MDGVIPTLFLNRCREVMAIFDFRVSDYFHGLESLMEYFRSRAEYLKNKPLLLGQYGAEDGGHAVGLKLKVEQGVRNPSILIIDYQHPAFLDSGLVNPFRFTSSIDTINYQKFIVFELM